MLPAQNARMQPRRTSGPKPSARPPPRDWLYVTERILTYLLVFSLAFLGYLMVTDGWFVRISVDGIRNSSPDGDYPVTAQTVRFGHCRDRAAAGPTKGVSGGFGETVPRPISVASYSAIAERWGADETKRFDKSGGSAWMKKATALGTEFLHTVAASLKEEHVADADGIAGVSVSHGRDEVLKHVSEEAIKASGDCASIPKASLHEAAEAALGLSVESRLWACILVRSALSLPVEDPKLAVMVGVEKLWHSPEYRIFLREWTRHNLRHSGGMCHRGFGTKYARYIAAGVWGVTYSRCITDKNCDQLPRVILKLAGLPSDTAWKDAETGRQYMLSSASLGAGFDLGVESYMNEAVRILVAHGVTPHLIIGYGTWVCDNFAIQPEGKRPITGLFPEECKSRKFKKTGPESLRAVANVSEKEKTTLCTNILDEVRTNVQSQNLPVMAQEEVLMGMQDAFASMHDNLRHTPKAWHQAVAGVLFEITYTVAALQQHFGHFRHNDMSWYNVRTTVPSHLNVSSTDKLTKETVVRQGTMFAPVDKRGFARTHTEYTTAKGVFRVPNYGYSLRIADWDFAHATGVPRLYNPKILDVRTKSCGETIPDNRVWFPPSKVTKASIVWLDPERSESTEYIDAGGKNRTCQRWAEVGCAEFDFVKAEFTPHERLRVLSACPKACKSRGGVVRLVIDPPVFRDAANIPDDPSYKDKEGSGCSDWVGQCDTAHCNGGYTKEEEAELFKRCPNACQRPAQPPAEVVDGKKQYIVRIYGNDGIPDGIYRAIETPRENDAAKWQLEVVLANRTDLDLRLPRLGSGTVEFLQRPHHSDVALVARHTKNGFQRHLYRLRLDRRRFEAENFQSRDLVYIVDNAGGHNGIFKVESVPRKGKAQSNHVELDVISIRMNGKLPAKRTTEGGAMFRVGVRCKSEFFEYSTYGITPHDNDKFDLYFFFNQLQDYMSNTDWDTYFPEESKALVFKLFEQVSPDLRGWYKPLVHDYRMTNNHARWWCDRKGTWNTNSTPIAGFGTPYTIMGSELFTPFRVKETEPAASGVTIAKYSLSAKLPDEFCIGTGELPIKTADKP